MQYAYICILRPGENLKPAFSDEHVFNKELFFSFLFFYNRKLSSPEL